MTLIAQFRVPGPVQPWQRAGSRGRQKFTRPETAMYQNLVKITAKDAMKGKPPVLTGPVQAVMTFRFPIPESWPIWKKEAAANGHLVHDKKPDADNLMKTIMDACNGIVYGDDCQVFRPTINKLFARGGDLFSSFLFTTPDNLIGTKSKKSDYLNLIA